MPKQNTLQQLCWVSLSPSLPSLKLKQCQVKGQDGHTQTQHCESRRNKVTRGCSHWQVTSFLSIVLCPKRTNFTSASSTTLEAISGNISLKCRDWWYKSSPTLIQHSASSQQRKSAQVVFKAKPYVSSSIRNVNTCFLWVGKEWSFHPSWHTASMGRMKQLWPFTHLPKQVFMDLDQVSCRHAFISPSLDFSCSFTCMKSFITNPIRALYERTRKIAEVRDSLSLLQLGCSVLMNKACLLTGQKSY